MKPFSKKEFIIFPGTAIILTGMTVFLVGLQYFFKPSFSDKTLKESDPSINLRKSAKPSAKEPAPQTNLPEKKESDKTLIPYAAVVDFAIDPSVKDKSVTGSSFAARLEQRLGMKYKLVERKQISKVMEELKLQSSDLAEKPRASEFGKIVGAEFLITGTVLKSGGNYVLAAKIFDLKGQITQKAEITVEKLGSISKDDFNRLAKLLTMSPKERKEKNIAKTLAEEAELYIKRKDYKKAAAYLEKALQTDPENEKAIELLPQTKEELIRQASERKRNDKFSKIYAQSAKDIEKKELDKAIAGLKKALKMTGTEHIQEKRQ
jgi:tetratricopeptide (TPR) repeat protein